MSALVDWLGGWPGAVLLQRSGTAYLFVNAAHILGIGLLLGAILPLDLRLAGVLRASALPLVCPILIRTAACGLALGLLVAFNIDVIVPAIEHALHASFLPKDIYLISKMPSDPQSSDIVPIALISLALAFIATIYPSWRASRVQPAQALRSL